MRRTLIRLMACAAGIVAVVSIVDATRGEPPGESREGQPPRVTLDRRPLEEFDAAQVAGLPEDSHPEVLTWERAYALALIRGRAEPSDRGRGLAESLDPKVLADQSERLGVADFARFREDLFARPGGPGESGGTFRDPSGDVIDLLCQLQAIEDARLHVASLEDMRAYASRRIVGEASGLRLLDLDRIGLTLVRAHRGLSDAVMSYRDKLDALKVELGLSPHAPVVLDRESLAGFRAVYEGTHRWFFDPKRDPVRLSLLAKQLPSLGDVVIDGRPVLDVIDLDPDRLEDVLAAAVRVALKNRGESDRAPGAEASRAALELRLRRRIRHLFETRRAYEEERRRFVFVLRLKDQAEEQLTAPPPEGPSPSRSPAVIDLIAQEVQVQECQDRLVALWASFRAERLALYRDLRTMPFDNWKSFYEQFSAPRDEADPGPQAPQDIPNAPAPPAPAGS